MSFLLKKRRPEAPPPAGEGGDDASSPRGPQRPSAGQGHGHGVERRGSAGRSGPGPGPGSAGPSPSTGAAGGRFAGGMGDSARALLRERGIDAETSPSVGSRGHPRPTSSRGLPRGSPSHGPGLGGFGVMEGEDGLPQEWVEAPSRQRRFTASARPDLHLGEQFRLDDEPELSRDFQNLKDLLEEMEDEVLRAQEEAERERSEEEDPSMSLRKSPGSSRGSRSSRGSGRSKKRKTFRVPPECRMQGFLYKRGQRRRNWTWRFFRIDAMRCELKYYKDDNWRFAKPKGSINLKTTKLVFPVEQRSHKNRQIQSRFEFHLQEYESERFQFVVRTYELAADGEDALEEWTSRLALLEQAREDFKHSHPTARDPSVPGTLDPEEVHRRWDEAQNWRAYGGGLFEGRVGDVCTFHIEARDELGDRLGIPSGKPSAVLESEDLHYDLEVHDTDTDGIFTVEYTPSRLGEFELTVVLNGFDIYGSPFHPQILPASVRTGHCTAEGLGLMCSVIDQPNEFVITSKNQFDDVVKLDEGQSFTVLMEEPLKLDYVHDNGDGTFRVAYFVEISRESLAEKQAAGEYMTGTISILLNDGKNETIPERHINNSPFTSGIAASLSAEDIAAAYTASEFNKMLREREMGETGAENPFIAFSNMLKQSGLLVVGDGSRNGPPSRPRAPSSPQSFAASPQSPMPPSQQQQQQQYEQSQEAFETQAPSSFAYFPSFSTSNSNGGWVPHERELPLVQQSLEDRAKEIEREKEDLIRKRRELDESRHLIDEQVRRMAEVGRKTQHDQEQAGENLQSPLQYAAREKIIPSSNTSNKEQQPIKKNRSATKTPKESATRLLDPPMIALFDKHSVTLSRVFEYYQELNGTQEFQLTDVIQMCQDYDIAPTFMSRKEIRDLYSEINRKTNQSALSYETFVELLAQIAVTSLSDPMFAHLYTTNIKKVNVLLTMWKVADPIKLQEIQGL